MTDSIYTDGQYLAQTETWHLEDSPWKAEQIEKIVTKNKINPEQIAEVGCGVGGILAALSQKSHFSQSQFVGYEISPQACNQAKQREHSRLRYYCEDIINNPWPEAKERFDLLLALDVFEHVPDYMGFLQQCRAMSRYQLYHIPLDIHVSAVLRNSFGRVRQSIGHIHYFTADTALAVLRDTGHEIVDFTYTSPALDLIKLHPSFKTYIANMPRRLFSKLSLPFTARVFGGYSLLVLTK
jgi:SAM-dependent methyltransferase